MRFVGRVEVVQTLLVQDNVCAIKDMLQLIHGGRTKYRRTHKGARVAPCQRHVNRIDVMFLSNRQIGINRIKNTRRDPSPEVIHK